MGIMIEHSRVAVRFPLGKVSEALSRVSGTEGVTSGYLVNERETSINPYPYKIRLSALLLLSRANISCEVSISHAEKMYLKMASIVPSM